MPSVPSSSPRLGGLTSRSPGVPVAARAALILVLACAPAARALCPEEPMLKNYTGGGQIVCPCFVPGEQAGSVLNAPASHYPIQILRVGIGWGSQNGGAPQSLEQAIHIYPAGLPNPGVPIFTLDGPVLSDGFINEFDLEPEPGDIIVNSGPFTVTLEFLNENSGDPSAPSVVNDGNGCQSGKNVIYAIPGGWLNVCSLGLSGDWVFYAIYRRVNCVTGVEEQIIASTGDGLMIANAPNPFAGETQIAFRLPAEAPVDLSVFDTSGRLIATLLSGRLPSGVHQADWNGTDASGQPVASGTYFLRLNAGDQSATRRLSLLH